MRRTVIVAFLVVGCGGGGPDIGGMYQVTEHLEDSMGCGPGAPPMTPDAYFVFRKEEFFGQDFYAMDTCSGSDPATCTGFGVGPMAEHDDDGWFGWISFSSGDTTSCTLEFDDYHATRMGDDGVLLVEERDYRETDVMGVNCEPEDAEARGTEMPCVSYVKWVGTRIGDAPEQPE